MSDRVVSVVYQDYPKRETFKAELINVVRIDGEWVAIILRLDDQVIYTIDAADIEAWHRDNM